MNEPAAPAETDYIRPLAHLNGEKPPAPAWFEAAIAQPSEEGVVEVNGADIVYSAWGERGAPGLLFIHGGRAHRNWWRPFAPFFAEGHRVAALDLSGMGDSGWRQDYDFECRIDEVFAVIEAAGLDGPIRPIIVGHSFGGWVTLAAVEKQGDRLGGAVVIDSPLKEPDPNEGYVIKTGSRTPSPNRGTRIYSTLEEPITRFRFLPQQSSSHLYLVDYIAREGLRHTDSEDGAGWTWKFDPKPARRGEIHFERELLRAARCPLAFIYGEKSFFATDAAISHIREQARGRSPFMLMPEAHHHLMMDNPIAFISSLRMLLASWPVRVGG